MFNLPKCAREGCPRPGLVKVVFTDDSGDVAAFLCPLCLGKAPELFKEVAAVKEEQRMLLEQREDHGEKAPA